MMRLKKDGPISQYYYLNDNEWLMPLLLYVQMVFYRKYIYLNEN